MAIINRSPVSGLKTLIATKVAVNINTAAIRVPPTTKNSWDGVSPGANPANTTARMINTATKTDSMGNNCANVTGAGGGVTIGSDATF